MMLATAKWVALAAALLNGVRAQVASGYTDPASGITFQGLTDSDTGFTIGIALPETIGTDFIGQVILPLNNSAGWAGTSLGGGMTNSILLVAWPNAGEILTSFREATQTYAGDAALTLKTIPDGTYVNDTHMSLTYLCAGCITGDASSFSSTDETAVLGYAFASTGPTGDSSDAEAELPFHDAGYSQFGVTLADAQSPDYDSWAGSAERSHEDV
ncbi:iron reductase domain protein [Cylindrobasidium torrendii FP15055 ss-10]|uniref:Iron reductase domain protein n=1 Tax=Cylindrobasidium torrendii FP15055 ss-10 TaxID=1314674 RepID=A0A0D7BH62_9AGAR|nr:iron reductase domain protein [Cylindrobasidium torrendii FP15055 ss-10]